MGAYSILIKQCRAIEALGKTELNAVIEHYGEPADEPPDAGNQRRRRGGKNEKPRGFYCFAKQKKGATQQ